ncbi:unnamed protein product [Adineta ricciae]|uniref:CUB domain-containing protein n=1 Tax=Adineta ricciae TaxID=249248 RepID=A0A816DUR4_ADIRI|nr:unnamed protein product [Adineta ricciae]CAF1640603.1 unnamed protein product [Adineta ricciae]
MISTYCFVLLLFTLFNSSYSLQSGYTCETSVTLKCPDESKLVILEVTYSSECPSLNEEKEGGTLYAPSRCIGYRRDVVSRLCNGQQTCTIDNNLTQRPSFIVGKQANCAFTGQSINVDYSCVPDFYSSKLPRIDICSLQSLHDVNEGFIHTPNYPGGYPNSRTCSKTVPSPPEGHRLKIYALDFDVEGLSALRLFGITRINDWLQINNSGEKMYGSRPPYTPIFDDVIEASLMFKSDFANTKRPYNGFLLYFIITPLRVAPPSTTTAEKVSSTTPAILSNDELLTSSVVPRGAALISNDQRSNSIGMTLLVVVLSSILFIILCAFILYKRRNDRRVRYLTDTFNAFFPTRTKNVSLNTTDVSDEVTLNTTVQSKLDVSSVSNNEKLKKMNNYEAEYVPPSILKHVNINERRDSQEKQIFIENLKTCPSPYSSYRRSERKFNTKEQIDTEADQNSNIYSQDPLTQIKNEPKHDNNSLIYEDVDLNAPQPTNEQEDVIYDVINPNNERVVEQQECEYESPMYATPKNA